jgi:hypothetical protein
VALKDKAARAAYNKLYREQRAANLSDGDKARLRELHNAKQKEYCAQGYNKSAHGADRQRLREPKTIAARRSALRWDRLRSASRDARRWDVIEDARAVQLRLLSEIWFAAPALSP